MSELPDRPAAPQPIVERVRAWLHWFGIARLGTSVLTIAGVLAGAAWLLRPPPITTESKLPFATTHSVDEPATPAPTSTPAATERLIVHVAGAVELPGVYQLAAGARVIDAVHAAGGLAVDANADAVNLAAAVADGDRVYVPRIGEVPPPIIANASPGLPGGAAPAGPINVNTADAAALESLPGVGPATAAAIIAHRTAHGAFRSVDDLADVRGIGPAKLESLRGQVTV